MRWLKRIFGRAALPPPQPTMGPLATAIAAAMREPGWVITKYTLDNANLKMELWIANGEDYFRIYKLNGENIPEVDAFRLTTYEQGVLWARYIDLMQEQAASTIANLMLLTEFKDKEKAT